MSPARSKRKAHLGAPEVDETSGVFLKNRYTFDPYPNHHLVGFSCFLEKEKLPVFNPPKKVVSPFFVRQKKNQNRFENPKRPASSEHFAWLGVPSAARGRGGSKPLGARFGSPKAKAFTVLGVKAFDVAMGQNPVPPVTKAF